VTRTDKWVQQAYRIQDQHTKINYIYALNNLQMKFRNLENSVHK
jgi:hypothetical protein